MPHLGVGAAPFIDMRKDTPGGTERGSWKKKVWAQHCSARAAHAGAARALEQSAPCCQMTRGLSFGSAVRASVNT